MATKLKNLKVSRVALVDEGANPEAHIRFIKRRTDASNAPIATPAALPNVFQDTTPSVLPNATRNAPPPAFPYAPTPSADETSFVKRLILSTARAFGVDDITHQAHANQPTTSSEADAEAIEKARHAHNCAVSVAKRYALLGASEAALVPVLKSLKAAGEKPYADMINVLDSALATVEKSSVFGELGHRGGAEPGGAWEKIERVAVDIQKAKPNTTWANAIDLACVKHPELVKEYELSR